ncbi:uncharacterized protein L969DRAFT_75321 [Mixia osmundae IAM 14324]|nr:uncharacterized protein L969DRAFT_75321 [Mixia osmundae IAM 14324]KEI38668.1 hypothetical protein L969DRAFT_75321 [Mixia osmundae IAM 14324]
MWSSTEESRARQRGRRAALALKRLVFPSSLSICSSLHALSLAADAALTSLHMTQRRWAILHELLRWLIAFFPSVSQRSDRRAIPMLAFAILAFAGCVLAASEQSSAFAIHDTARHVPKAWKPVAMDTATRNGQVHRLHFALRQSNLAKLEAETTRRSDPVHADYGKYLSPDEINGLIAPSSSTVAAFENWLASHGIDRSSIGYNKAKDWAHIDLKPDRVDKMLNTNLEAYKHSKTGETILRTSAYSLPLYLHEYVDAVQPTTYFGLGRAGRKLADESAQHSDVDPRTLDKRHPDSLSRKPSREPQTSTKNIRSAYTPSKAPPSCPADADIYNPDYVVHRDCLRSFLRVDTYQVKSRSTEPKAGVVGFDGFVPAPVDFRNHSLHEIGPEAWHYTYDLVSINGGSTVLDLATDNIEPFLDVDQVAKIIWPLRQVYYTIGGLIGKNDFRPSANSPTPDLDEPWFSGMTALFDHAKVPKVLAASYDDDERTFPPMLAQRICAIFTAFAARGVSVIVASGDYGLSGGAGSCTSADGKSEELVPGLPASCPFVTSVGGTELYDPERVAGTHIVGTNLTAWMSGAGISNYFERPQYQRSAVAAYKGASVPENIKWSKTGRASPDVSITATKSAVWAGGQEFLVGGTSNAAPTFAGLVALLNDALEAEGRPSMGFLNPWLYHVGNSAFRDITVGASYGCGPHHSSAKFAATPGFDLATGWGTPDWPSLLSAALASGPRSVCLSKAVGKSKAVCKAISIVQDGREAVPITEAGRSIAC